MAKITLPSGRKVSVVPAEQIKVGAYRRMRKLNRLTGSNLSEEEQDEVTTLMIETLLFLIPDITEEEIEDLNFTQLNKVVVDATLAMSKDAGVVDDSEEETKNPSPQRGRKKKGA